MQRKKSVFVKKKKKTLRQDQFVEPKVYKLHFNPASQLSDHYSLLVNSRITNLYHSIKGKAYQQHNVVIYLFILMSLLFNFIARLLQINGRKIKINN